MNMTNASTERQAEFGIVCNACPDRQAMIERLQRLACPYSPNWKRAGDTSKLSVQICTNLVAYENGDHPDPMAVPALVRKWACQLQAEIERLQAIAKQHRETAEAYRDKYQQVSQAMGHILTIVQEAKQD